MGLLSVFKRKTDPAPKVSVATESGDDVQRARILARQRLIGAVVLVTIGIIGFPLVFETQPRPIPVDIPIEIPRKDGGPALVMPPARSPALPVPAPTAPSAVARDEVITESNADAGRDFPNAAPREADATPEAKPASSVPIKPSTPSSVPKPAVAAADGARAKALLDGKAPANSDASRFVVQVGAFADASAARETRLKVERLGLKTYTQVADTPGGSRIRVRVGPFATRDDADKAMAKARTAGLSAVVLTL